MKYIKNVISVLLCLSISIFVLPATAFASQPLDKQLVERNYPLQLIENMSEEEKKDLINEDCYFEASKTYNYDGSGNLINIEEVTEEDKLKPIENTASPYGQIKTKHLSLRITSSKSGTNKVITFSYDWLQMPLNRYQDPMSVAWDSNVFSYKSGTFKKVDKYVKILNGPEYTNSSETAYANAGSNYISWYADIPGYTKSPQAIYGYGKFTLKPKKSNKSTKIYGHYVHAKTAQSLSISYKGAGFSISGNSTYDELGTDLSLKS